jgi:hypothetical protein
MLKILNPQPQPPPNSQSQQALVSETPNPKPPSPPVQAAIDALKLLSSGFGSENDYLGGDDDEGGEDERDGSGGGYQGEELPGDDARGAPIAEETDGDTVGGEIERTPNVQMNGVLHHVTPLVKIDGMSIAIGGMMSSSPTITAQVFEPPPQRQAPRRPYEPDTGPTAKFMKRKHALEKALLKFPTQVARLYFLGCALKPENPSRTPC